MGSVKAGDEEEARQVGRSKDGDALHRGSGGVGQEARHTGQGPLLANFYRA